MKIFLGIKHFDDCRNKQLVQAISSLLHSRGFETISMIRDIEKWGEIVLTPKELMLKAFEAINCCDIVLIELSARGVGLGIEAGYAFANKKPVITIASKKTGISKSLEGISSAIFCYDNIDELNQFFNKLNNMKEANCSP